MDYQRQTNGWRTFLEHYWFLVVASFAILGSEALSFLARLTGVAWIWCYSVGLGVAVTGAGLILYAKVPLYRQWRFFTFGADAVPEPRRAFYHWGYRLVLFAVLLLVCLLLIRK